MNNRFENFLKQYTENDWLKALDDLLPAIHAVDRNATQIWFRFYPLSLHRYLQSAEDKTVALQKFVMQGVYELKDQIDSSHAFLYGHRFWKAVKDEISKRAESSFDDENTNLADEIRRIAKTVADNSKVEESLTLGISAVGLMTLTQVGSAAFLNAAKPTAPKGLMKKSPDQIVKERAKDDSQGLFGFLKTIDKQWTVRYDETDDGGKKYRKIRDISDVF